MCPGLLITGDWGACACSAHATQATRRCIPCDIHIFIVAQYFSYRIRDLPSVATGLSAIQYLKQTIYILAHFLFLFLDRLEFELHVN
jgi:hypothetical protein